MIPYPYFEVNGFFAIPLLLDTFEAFVAPFSLFFIYLAKIW